ncbi:MAG TPA: hypothetical protein PLU24_04765, partial [Candidatus Omnitrophota bacterium]|nr:hypothetical protein [Candidatus Omnitrophota bacterium]
GNSFLRFLFRYDVQQISTNQMIIAARFARKVNLVKNDQRYLMPIAMSLGAKKMDELETAYTPRRHGCSKYNLIKKSMQGFPEIFDLKLRISGDFIRLFWMKHTGIVSKFYS